MKEASDSSLVVDLDLAEISEVAERAHAEISG